MARSATLALSGTLILAGCGAPQQRDAVPANDTAAATADTPATPTVDIAARDTPTDTVSPTPAVTAGPSSTPSPATQGIVSCAAEIGRAKAQRLADQCRNVSPATRPPCNVANSCAMIRSEIARSCSVIDNGSPLPADCAAKPASAEAATQLLRIYYAAIEARDYGTAWQLWDGDGERSGKTLAAFERGFAGTVGSAVTPGTPGRVEGAAGSSYVTIPVTVNARLSDGTRQRFTGSYVLRRSNIERSQGWAIYSASLRKAG